MLPLEKPWYRSLLLLALLLGAAGGVLALVFNGITVRGIDFFFGAARHRLVVGQLVVDPANGRRRVDGIHPAQAVEGS